MICFCLNRWHINYLLKKDPWHHWKKKNPSNEVDGAFAWGLPRAEHFWFGPVLDQTKQPNQNYYFFKFLNRIESKTDSNQLISVWFSSVFPLPNWFKPKLFQMSFFLAFYLPRFLGLLFFYLNYMQCHHIRNLSNNDYIFHGFLSTQQQKLNFLLHHQAISF